MYNSNQPKNLTLKKVIGEKEGRPQERLENPNIPLLPKEGPFKLAPFGVGKGNWGKWEFLGWVGKGNPLKKGGGRPFFLKPPPTAPREILWGRKLGWALGERGSHLYPGRNYSQEITQRRGVPPPLIKRVWEKGQSSPIINQGHWWGITHKTFSWKNWGIIKTFPRALLVLKKTLPKNTIPKKITPSKKNFFLGKKLFLLE